MSGDRTVDEYVSALSRELRVGPLRRRRILAEVEHHLRDAAARAPRDGAEQAAIERFGRVEEIASRFNRQWRARTRAAAAAILVGIGVVFFSVQGLMDGVLPPAPWPEDAAPAAVAWQSGAAQACLVAALLLALAALGGRRWSATATGLAVLGVALAAAFVSHYELERGALVAGSPGGWELAGVFALRAAALAPAALLLAGRMRLPRALLTP
jgi:hypothetical protein